MASKRKRVQQDEDVNPLIALNKRYNDEEVVNLMPVTSEHLRWHKLGKEAKACYNRRLAKLQKKEIAVPKLVSGSLLRQYNLIGTLKDLWRMRTEFGDQEYEDRSFEYAVVGGEKQIYKEWCLEFFATIYFNQKVKDIMDEKCIWFRLCGHDHVYTLPEFGQLLGLYDENDLEHVDFEDHFAKLEIELDKYVGREIWNQIGDPNSVVPFNERDVHSPLARLLHKVIVNSFVHRGHSQHKVHATDLWIMEMLMDPNRNMNVLWTLAVYLSKRAAIMSEHGFINGGHYVTRIGKTLGYDTEEELRKITVIKECEKLDKKALKDLLDDERMCLVDRLENVIRNPPPPQQNQQNVGESSGLNASWGDWHANLPSVDRREIWKDMSLMRIGHQMDYCAPLLTHIGQNCVPPYPFPMAYEPIGVPPYPYPYTPYPSGHVPYPTYNTGPSNEGCNVSEEAFAGYYSNVGTQSYEAGTSSGGLGYGPLVTYAGDETDDE